MIYYSFFFLFVVEISMKIHFIKFWCFVRSTKLQVNCRSSSDLKWSNRILLNRTIRTANSRLIEAINSREVRGVRFSSFSCIHEWCSADLSLCVSCIPLSLYTITYKEKFPIIWFCVCLSFDRMFSSIEHMCLWWCPIFVCLILFSLINCYD